MVAASHENNGRTVFGRSNCIRKLREGVCLAAGGTGCSSEFIYIDIVVDDHVLHHSPVFMRLNMTVVDIGHIACIIFKLHDDAHGLLWFYQHHILHARFVGRRGHGRLGRIFAIHNKEVYIVDMEGVILYRIAMQHPYFCGIQIYGVVIYIVVVWQVQ